MKINKTNAFYGTCKTLLLLSISLMLILFSAGCDARTKPYREALAQMSQGQYEDAKTQFIALGDYEDSAEQAAECELAINEEKYQDALEMFNKGEFDTAKSLFLALGEYKDSAEQVKICDEEKKYTNALSLLDQDKYNEAWTLFIELGEYNDSGKQADICRGKLIDLGSNSIQACDHSEKLKYSKLPDGMEAIMSIEDGSLSGCYVSFKNMSKDQTTVFLRIKTTFPNDIDQNTITNMLNSIKLVNATGDKYDAGAILNCTSEGYYEIAFVTPNKAAKNITKIQFTVLGETQVEKEISGELLANQKDMFFIM